MLDVRTPHLPAPGAGGNPAPGTAPPPPQFVASCPRPVLQPCAYGVEADSESDEERTHANVLSRRMHKRRKTSHALVSNPFCAPSDADFSLAGTPPMFGLEGSFEEFPSSPTSAPSRLCGRRGSIVPESDVYARQRCYEYIHTAIDAVWAEYCDSTSFAESQKYMPHSPISDHGSFVSSSDDGGKEAVYTHTRHMRSDSISMQPHSQSLMKQKKRLVDAKYLLSHFVNNSDADSSASFWRVWDRLKYDTAEIVEGDEEDVEEIIEELEEGRFDA